MVRASRGVAVASAVLVLLLLLRAVVAGQGFFGSWEIEVHGWLGNASFLAGPVLVVVAVRGRARRVLVALAAALFVQSGLGSAGRTALPAASRPVPLGVAIFGLSIANATLVRAPSPPSLSGGAGLLRADGRR